MRVVLLKDIKGLGKKFEEKEVANGYAMNFLIPQKMAVPAGSSVAGTIKTIKEHEEQERRRKKDALLKNANKIKNLELITRVAANEKGHLFAAINSEEISKLLREEGIEIEPDYIEIEEPIKSIGVFEISVILDANDQQKRVKFKLKVEPLSS